MTESTKQFAVVFTRTNSRVIRYQDIKEIGDLGNVVVNPDLSMVRGVPPHFWTLIDGHIIPMNEEQKRVRIIQLESPPSAQDIVDQKIAKLEIAALKKLEEEAEKEREEERTHRLLIQNQFKTHQDAIEFTHKNLKDQLDGKDAFLNQKIDETSQAFKDQLAVESKQRQKEETSRQEEMNKRFNKTSAILTESHAALAKIIQEGNLELHCKHSEIERSHHKLKDHVVVLGIVMVIEVATLLWLVLR